jgi:rRNA pseudouridine-1189 N-methylase Emg1 (Nep1/Mra1 family)
LEERVPLAEAVKRIGAQRVLALEQGGRRVELSAELPALAQAHEHVAVILGGFPHGSFRSPVAGLAHETWSLSDASLSVWVAAAEVLVNWENATRGMPQHRGPKPRAEAQEPG